MKVTLLHVAVGLVWAGAAITSATPADARVFTSQSGSYATVTNLTTNPANAVNCNVTWNYQQNIRFLGTSCNQGGSCPSGDQYPWVEAVYAGGRKQAFLSANCSSTHRIYSLGSCSC